MAGNCSLCVHSERSAIDKALISGTPYREIAKRYGTSLSTLQRHKPHLTAALLKSGADETLLPRDVRNAANKALIASAHRANTLADFYRDHLQRIHNLESTATALLDSAAPENPDAPGARIIRDGMLAISSLRELRGLLGERTKARELLARGQGELSPDTRVEVSLGFAMLMPPLPDRPVIDITPESEEKPQDEPES